jgi:hypothetical protein
VWGAVRKAKEREMAASPSKIKSLERGRSPPILHSPLQRRAVGAVCATGRAGALSSASAEEAAIIVSHLRPYIYMRKLIDATTLPPRSVEFKESADGTRVRVAAIDVLIETAF